MHQDIGRLRHAFGVKKYHPLRYNVMDYGAHVRSGIDFTHTEHGHLFMFMACSLHEVLGELKVASGLKCDSPLHPFHALLGNL